MITWVVYDIKKDKIRNAVAKTCKQFGLYRVQYSVFLGVLTKNQLDSLGIAMEDLINVKTDSVYIFPMSREELRVTILLGQAFDKKFVTDEVKSLFF